MENNCFVKDLKRYIKEKVIVSVYSNRDQSDKCSVGYIEAISNEHFIMQHISPNGMYDGYAIRQLDDIFRVDVNGNYEQRLALLYKLQNQRHENLLKNKSMKAANLFNEALHIAKELNIVATVCIDEAEEQDDIVGFVKQVDNLKVIVSRLTFEGSNDGESIFMIDDVVKINCDSLDEKALKVLSDSRKIAE